MRHFKDPRFQPLYDALPARVRTSADKSFALLEQDPKHPSLHFKCIKGDLWSVRIGQGYRALAIEGKDGFQWLWIGSHAARTMTGCWAELRRSSGGRLAPRRRTMSATGTEGCSAGADPRDVT